MWSQLAIVSHLQALLRYILFTLLSTLMVAFLIVLDLLSLCLSPIFIEEYHLFKEGGSSLLQLFLRCCYSLNFLSTLRIRTGMRTGSGRVKAASYLR